MTFDKLKLTAALFVGFEVVKIKNTEINLCTKLQN